MSSSVIAKLNSITASYRDFIIGDVFERLGIAPELFVNCAVNLGTGELIIKEPDKPPAQSQKAEATGKP